MAALIRSPTLDGGDSSSRARPHRPGRSEFARRQELGAGEGDRRAETTAGSASNVSISSSAARALVRAELDVECDSRAGGEPVARSSTSSPTCASASSHRLPLHAPTRPPTRCGLELHGLARRAPRPAGPAAVGEVALPRGRSPARLMTSASAIRRRTPSSLLSGPASSQRAGAARRLRGGSPSIGETCSLLQAPGHFFIRSVGAERQVPRTLFFADDGACQPAMHPRRRSGSTEDATAAPMSGCTERMLSDRTSISPARRARSRPAWAVAPTARLTRSTEGVESKAAASSGSRAPGGNLATRAIQEIRNRVRHG